MATADTADSPLAELIKTVTLYKNRADVLKAAVERDRSAFVDTERKGLLQKAGLKKIEQTTISYINFLFDRRNNNKFIKVFQELRSIQNDPHYLSATPGLEDEKFLLALRLNNAQTEFGVPKIYVDFVWRKLKSKPIIQTIVQERKAADATFEVESPEEAVVAAAASPVAEPLQRIQIGQLTEEQLQALQTFVGNTITSILNAIKVLSNRGFRLGPENAHLIQGKEELLRTKQRFDILVSSPRGDSPSYQDALVNLLQTAQESLRKVNTTILESSASRIQTEEDTLAERETRSGVAQLRAELAILNKQYTFLEKQSVGLSPEKARAQSEDMLSAKDRLAELTQLYSSNTSTPSTPEAIEEAKQEHRALQTTFRSIAQQQGTLSKFVSLPSLVTPGFVSEMQKRIGTLVPEISESTLAKTFSAIKKFANKSEPEKKKYKIGKLTAASLDTKVAVFGESYDFRLLHTPARENAPTNTNPSYSDYFDTSKNSAEPSEKVEETLFYYPRDTFDQRYLGWMKEDINRKQLRNFFRFVFGTAEPANRELYQNKTILQPIDKIPCEGTSEEQKELVSDFRKSLEHRLRGLRQEVLALNEVLPVSDEKRRRLETMMEIVQFLNKIDARDTPCVEVTRDVIDNKESAAAGKDAELPQDQIEIKKFLDIILRRLLSSATGPAATRIQELLAQLNEMINPTTIQEILAFFNDVDSAKRVEELEAELKECREKLAELREGAGAQAVADGQTIQQLEAEKESIRGDNRFIMQRILVLQREKVALQAQLRDTGNGLAAAEEEIARLRAALAEAVAEIERRGAAFEQLRVGAEAERGRLQAALDAMTRERDALQVANQELTNQIEALRRTIGEREAEIGRNEARIRELEGLLREQTARADGLEAQIAAATSAHQAALAALGQQQGAAIAALQAQHQQALTDKDTEKARALEAQVQELRAKCDEEKATLRGEHEEAIRNLNYRHREEINRREQRNNELEAQLRAAQRDLATAQRDLATAQRELRECREASAAEKERLLAQIRQLSGEIARLRGIEVAIGAAEGDKEEAQAEAARLQEQLGPLQARLAALQRELAEANRLKQAAEQRVGALATEVRTLTDELAAARAQLAAKTKECDDEKRALQARIAALEAELEEARKKGGQLPEPIHAWESDELPDEQRELTPEQAAGLYNVWENFMDAILKGKTDLRRQATVEEGYEVVGQVGKREKMTKQKGQPEPFVSPFRSKQNPRLKSDDELLGLEGMVTVTKGGEKKRVKQGEIINEQIGKMYREIGWGPTLQRYRPPGAKPPLPSREDEIQRPKGVLGTGWQTQKKKIEENLIDIKMSINEIKILTTDTQESVNLKNKKKLETFIRGLERMNHQTAKNFLGDLFVIGYLATKQDDSKIQAIFNQLKDLKSISGVKSVLWSIFGSETKAREWLYRILQFRVPEAELPILPAYQGVAPPPPAGAAAVEGEAAPEAEAEELDVNNGNQGGGGLSRSRASTALESLPTEDLCAELLILMLKAAADQDDFNTVEFLQTASQAFQEIGTCTLILEFLQRLLTRAIPMTEEAWEDGYSFLPLESEDVSGAHLPSVLQALEARLAAAPPHVRRPLQTAARSLFPTLRATVHAQPSYSHQSLLGTKPYILVRPLANTDDRDTSNPLLLRLPDDSEPVELEEDDLEALESNGLSLGELLYYTMVAANDTLSASEQKLARCPLKPLLNQLATPLPQHQSL